MKKRFFLPLSFLAAAIVFLMLAFSGCNNLDVEGPPLENVKPWINWAITPSDSIVHSFNPTLHWWGNDQDGQINDILYGVFQGDYMDSVSRETSLPIPDTLTWISLGNVRSATIPLVASPDSSDTIGQYVVLKAIDDSGEPSDIINRFLYRTNHRPTCIVDVPDEPQWSLPMPTDSWSGIVISWEGGDSLDYIGPQPDFLWDVRVYGPYADSASAYGDTANFDTSTAPLYYVLTDNDEDPYRVEASSYSFYDLVTGFYIIFVRNYDDADVPSRPALGVIEVYEPHWIRHPDDAKDVMLFNQSNYSPLSGDLPNVWADSVQMFYEDMLDNAGIASDKWDWFDRTPTIADLYLYRMVIIIDVDWFREIADSTQEPFIDYLDVGGKLWINGRMSFYNTAGSSGRYDYEGQPAEPLVSNYLGLSAAYFPSIADGAEFTGAKAYDNFSSTFPDISVDTLKVQALNGNFDYAMPQIEFLILGPGTESMYKFTAINPNASGTFNDFPVAVRYATDTFRTSYFSYPLFMMEYDEASEIFNTMLQWFMEE